MLLPLVLILYPARCGTWLGARLQFGRLRNAVKTFIEAMNGSYKDGSAGTRDYRALPGLLLLSGSAIVTCCFFRGNRFFQQSSAFICVALLLMARAAFFGLFRPYKTRRHNLYGVLISSLAAVQCIHFFGILSLLVYEHGVIAVSTFLPLFVIVVYLLKRLILKCYTRT